MVAKKIPGATTHPNEWGIWRAMRSRCNQTLKFQKEWKKYWEKGIIVCPQWNDPDTGFKQFLSDMGPRPSENHSIDRIDNDGNYEPGNCRWATPQEQAWNSAASDKVLFEGEILPYAEIARRVGIEVGTLLWRVTHEGWSLEEATTRPIQTRHQLTYRGKTQTARQWAVELGLSPTTVYHRLRKGLPVEEILSSEKQTGKYERTSGKFYERGVKK